MLKKLLESFELKKRKRKFQKNFTHLMNLLIVIDKPEKSGLDKIKNSLDTTLSYATSFEILKKERERFEKKNNTEIEMATLYMLLYSISYFNSSQKDQALKYVKITLEMASKFPEEFAYEARLIHYVGTILITNIISHNIFLIQEKKLLDELTLKNDVKEKVKKYEILMEKINSGKYDSIGEKKKDDIKLRVLTSQKELYDELFEIELTINENIPVEFEDILNTLEDNLFFIEDEMIKNNFLNNEDFLKDNTSPLYPQTHTADIIYTYLFSQKLKIAFYKKDMPLLRKIMISFYKKSYSTNWINPLVTITKCNMEETLIKIMPINNLVSFIEFINNLTYEIKKDENDKIIKIEIKQKDINENNN